MSTKRLKAIRIKGYYHSYGAELLYSAQLIYRAKSRLASSQNRRENKQVNVNDGMDRKL